MVREIVKDTMFLMQKSKTATKSDIRIAYDLLDTLAAKSEICVGLAANMIGESKRIIAVQIGDIAIAMINPIIIKYSKESYETEEGCLSHIGKRKTIRYKSIEVEYYDIKFQKKKQIFNDFTAQIIQHEIDHCNGIII